MSIRVAICDDENYIVQELSDYFSRYGRLNNIEFNIAKFNNGDILLSYLQSHKDLEIIFLDIMMGDTNGVAVAKRIREDDNDIIIVFLTSYTKYALKGYTVGAERYLIKPLSYEQFENEIALIYDKIKKHEKKFIIEKTEVGISKIYLNELIYIEAFGRNVMLHTITRNYITNEKLKRYEGILDKSFFRCHRSVIINLAHFKELLPSDIVLTNNQIVPLSKYKKQALKEALLEFYGDTI